MEYVSVFRSRKMEIQLLELYMLGFLHQRKAMLAKLSLLCCGYVL